MWTEPRPTTHPTQAGGGGAAVAGWGPGLGEGEEGPPENTRVWEGWVATWPVSAIKTAALGVPLRVREDFGQETAERGPG